MRGRHIIHTSAVATMALLLSGGGALAVEAGLSPYLKGATAFMAGYVPPQQGFYVSPIYYYYHGAADAAVRDGAVELGVDVTLNAALANGVYVTGWKLFGADYALGGTGGYVFAGLDASLATPAGTVDVSLNKDAWGDTFITPVILGWHDGNFHWTMMFNAYAPTGFYKTGELSTGKNVWGFIPQFGLTYFDPKSGWEASAMISYVILEKNDATDYASGDLMHIDWAVGYHFGEEKAWVAGIAGNIVEQIGPDRGSGAALGSNKARSIGIGPALTYTTKLGSQPIIFNARWEHDIQHEKTFDGDTVQVQLTLPIL